jgi:hypothetical protein
MPEFGEIEEHHVTAIDVDGRSYNVTVSVENDGIEHVGHLWFSDSEWEDGGVRDHGAIPGRSADEILEQARALSERDLMRRFERARNEQRRFHGLRKLTEQVLEHIKYLNKVAVSMRAGLLAVEEAATEIDETEKKLHGMIDQLRHYAGVAA